MELEAYLEKGDVVQVEKNTQIMSNPWPIFLRKGVVGKYIPNPSYEHSRRDQVRDIVLLRASNSGFINLSPKDYEYTLITKVKSELVFLNADMDKGLYKNLLTSYIQDVRDARILIKYALHPAEIRLISTIAYLMQRGSRINGNEHELLFSVYDMADLSCMAREEFGRQRRTHKGHIYRKEHQSSLYVRKSFESVIQRNLDQSDIRTLGFTF